ncbi:MAG TPA: methyltransferase [Phycisphaerae bacterium]|jgi:SAM-dependent methyltransferase
MTAVELLYVDGHYAQANPTWHAEDSAWKAEQILRVAAFLPAEHAVRICDIGCGSGGVLAALGTTLAQRGIDAQLTGFDIAPLAIQSARASWGDLTNIDFACCNVLHREHLRFDICLLMDVLEHVADPRAFLVGLCDRGLSEFIIHLPLENNWLGIMRGRTDPRTSCVGHLHFYDTYSALHLLESSGLHVVQSVYTPEIDLDLRLHRTLGSIAAYLPRKLLLAIRPRLAVHTLGGAGLMARCVRAPH